MTHKHTYYKVGLDQQVHFRSRLIFSIITLLLLATSVSSLYAGIKSGKINEIVVEPVKKLVKELTTSEPIPNLSDPNNLRFTATSSSTINIEVNTNTSPKTPAKPIIKNTYTYPTPYKAPVYTTPPQPDFSSYDTARKQQEEWWTKVLEDFNNKSVDRNKSFQQFDQQAKQSLEDFKKESQQKTEQWKKEHGF